MIYFDDCDLYAHKCLRNVGDYAILISPERSGLEDWNQMEDWKKASKIFSIIVGPIFLSDW